ncbi:centrosome-associated zinc finger protein CP190 isoform X2 [Ooceraea biroi]|uniref:centrosome-associated zinc finger protein CP190 isoform X2 n=1 Tax=Ooceraea biroi TaxID=2015173 RepID=UPI000F073A91|nr:centrosome-associated zinc finger protein CP190 isoform X2 [Ooceraea biroi]
MESGVNQEKPPKGLKQVKVDNWGTFFLQRLQQMYFEGQFVDLKIKFPTNGIIVQAHRLVVTTCTDYFIQLEQEQKEKDEESFDGILMPSDMPYECVKSIITFMYTGQLEYWTSEQHALYRTAEKMNMTVLTKLLDAQFNSSSSSTDTGAKTSPRPIAAAAAAATKPAATATPKLVASSTTSASTLPGQPLPGRNTSSAHKPQEVTPGPSRFDLPEADDITLGVFSAFDDISYDTKLIQASDTYKKGSSDKRSSDGDGKNDSEDEEDESHETEKGSRDTNSDDDWSVSKSSQRSQNEPPAKRGRFDLEEKENMEKSNRSSAEDSLNNHANIIREVLKKYPHLVKNNKNIRLKIMQKEAKVSKDSNTPVKTKVSYVVMKSDHLLSSNEESDSKCNGNLDGGETGPWKCNKCDLDEEYTNYYMYRRHMQDVHEEKFDPRVCEHCGYKATKRNMLMYHLYTKHNVPPPKSMYFPKCQACSYVALSETLLVRHQINHDHRPASRHHSLLPEDIRCAQCNQTFRTFTELTTHELNTRHGSGKESNKSHRCPYCGKTFVRLTNLQVHLDCVHKELHRERDAESAPSTPAIPLEPSSEAEALSHVASGIAASLGVGDTETVPEAQVQEVTMVKATGDTQYIVPGMDLDDMTHNMNYTEHELEGQHMIMLVNNENYQHAEGDHHQQPQQLDIADNEQIVMQGTDDGMIVYIHGAEEANHRSYESYQPGEVTQETEEIVEEVVEEVEEEVVEEEEEEEEEEELELEQEVPQNMLEDGASNQEVEVIQYVEEQTEIVEYDEDQCSEQSSSMDECQESVMIIEEEHVEGEEVPETMADKRHKKVRAFTEWDEDSAGMTRS